MTVHHHHDHNLSCKELLGSISDYVDGELSEELCQEIRQHMAECHDCRVVLDTFNKTIYLYHTSAEETQTPADVQNRLFEKLNLNDYIKRK